MRPRLPTLLLPRQLTIARSAMLRVLVVPAAPSALILLLDLQRQLPTHQAEGGAHDLEEEVLRPDGRVLGDFVLHLLSAQRHGVCPQHSRAAA